MDNEMGFIHVIEKGSNDRVLILFHGTGADEHDLIPLGRQLDSQATLISPRGKSNEQGMLRFFKLPVHGKFDAKDLEYRTAELSNFITDSIKQYGLKGKEIFLIGFSNGANIAANLLLRDLIDVKGGILFKAMLVEAPKVIPNLANKKIMLSIGDSDKLIPRERTDRLVDYFRESKVHLHIKKWPWGHELHQEEIEEGKKWLQKH